jgi:hypothetical protein
VRGSSAPSTPCRRRSSARSCTRRESRCGATAGTQPVEQNMIRFFSRRMRHHNPSACHARTATHGRSTRRWRSRRRRPCSIRRRRWRRRGRCSHRRSRRRRGRSWRGRTPGGRGRGHRSRRTSAGNAGCSRPPSMAKRSRR